MPAVEDADVPMGIGWSREGDQVVATIIQLDKGRRETITTIRYDDAQAAAVASQLLHVIRR